MLPLRIAGATDELGKPKDWDPQKHGECMALSIRVEDFNGLRLMVSAWDFTPEEREMIAAGGVLELSVMGAAHPPVGMDVRLNASGRTQVPMTDLERACVEWSVADAALALALAVQKQNAGVKGVDIDTVMGELIKKARILRGEIHNLVTLKGPL